MKQRVTSIRRHAIVVASLGLLGCATGELTSTSHGANVDGGPASAKAPPPTPTTPDPSSTLLDASSGTRAADAAADASGDAAPLFGVQPTVNGTIEANEYGDHANGKNAQSTTTDPSSTTWLMTWTDTTLFVAITSANVNEGAVLYIDTDPHALGGAGVRAGYAYDNTNGALPFDADFVAYFKASYDEYRRSDGGAWSSSPQRGTLEVKAAGTTREIAIPWTAIRPAGRPHAFAWLGYVTSPGGYVYGAMPVGNPSGPVGTSATFSAAFDIVDTTTNSGPFGMKL